MIFAFDYTGRVGSGSKPQVLHMMDNSLRIVYLRADNTVGGMTALPNMGLYDSLIWKQERRLSPDDGVSFPSLKKVAHYGAYGFWSAAGAISGTDHRFVMYMLPMNITETLMDASLSFTKNSAVSSASFKFQNAAGSLLHRFRSLVSPNARIDLYFSFGGVHGNTQEIPMGKWYIDRVSTDTPGNEVSISARNTIGKLLKDQSFDENATFTASSLSENLKAILALAQVEESFVCDAGRNWNLTFAPEDELLASIEDVIRILPGWKVEENAAGIVGIGESTDTRFDQPSTYAFERDKNCWSYSLEMSDEETYSRLCLVRKEPEVRLYRDLDAHRLWPIPAHRTLYVSVPDGTSAGEMEQYANTLAASIANAGRTETFVGRFTPHMVIGDEVAMTADNYTSIIGIVTSVKHTMGRGGFYTNFTVDSGGRRGRPMLKDYLTQISNNKKVSSEITEPTL